MVDAVAEQIPTSLGKKDRPFTYPQNKNHEGVFKKIFNGARNRFLRKGETPETPSQESSHEDYVRWDRTIIGQKRVENSRFFDEPDGEAPHGYFKGRPIIGRDTGINGGVYIGSGKREALVVDDTKYPGLQMAYDTLLQRFAGGDKNVLQAAYEVTKKYLPTSEAAVDMVNKKLGIGRNDEKISLDAYFGKGGVCRHQALLAGYLLEKLVSEGRLKGHVSIDRNTIPGLGGHAFVRFEAGRRKNDVYIVDPTQNYVGSLADVPHNAWSYARKTDPPKTPRYK